MAFLEKDTVRTAFEESRSYMRRFFEPIAEFDRIARNRPSPNISPELPKVTDGTLASIVQEQPKRIIQQIPTGLVHCGDYPEYAQIANFVLTDKLLPRMKHMGNILQKSWAMTSKALTYGSSASYTFFTRDGDDMYMDFAIPYVKDLLIERGKVFGPDSNILFMRAWYQKSDLKAIIDREKKFQAANKKYKSEWDLQALADFIEAGASAKDADLQTPAEREKGGDTGGYEVIHAFQKGKDESFYSFAPKTQDGKVLRSKKNKDPRGAMPIDFMYCNIDLSNPIGRGQVELSGGVQNLIDQQMQMYQFISTLLMGPPTMVWGDVDRSSIKLRPNALIDMGTNANNKIDFWTPNNTAIQNFGNNYGLLKSQVLQLNSAQQPVSAEAGNPSFSKTQAGVKQQEARLGVSDNYLRKQFETWFGDECETALNIWFSEMSTNKDLELTQDQMKKLDQAAQKKFTIKNGKVTIPYKEINDVVFRFEVDASSSEVKEDGENVEKLSQALELAMKVQNPEIQQAIPKIFNAIVKEIGLENAEEIFPTLNGEQQDQPQGPDPNMIMQMVQEAVGQAMQAQKPPEKPLHESLNIKYADLPEDARRQILEGLGIQSQSPFPVDQVFDQKQQALDHTATKTALDVEKTAHQQTLDMHNASTPTPVIETTEQEAPEEVEPIPDGPLEAGEQEIVTALLQSGFDENDAEQAIVMLRQGVPEEEILQTLQAKRGQ